jgi:hypothetical protein
MKTLRLNRAESAAFANGERRFWRAIDLRKQGFDTAQPHENATWCREIETKLSEWEWWGPINEDGRGLKYQWGVTCPYGGAGDRIILAERNTCGQQSTITAITVEKRGGKWGWVVEVGNE